LALNAKKGSRDDGESETFVTAFSHTQGLDAQASSEDWPTLRRNGGGMGVGVGVGVRRLTPTECERLQALPDGWTDHGPDSRRYSAVGDAVTSSVSEWIGRRLIAAQPIPAPMRAKPKKGALTSS
jgi:DNA (cytosine-5)-methyltransferase 1